MKRFNIKNIEKALTIKELIFSITIIAVLTSMLFVIIKPLSQNDKAYDTRRVSDLKTVQKALERYQFDNGRYPESSSGSGNWGGHCLGFGNDDNYIPELVAQGYLVELPLDPKFDIGEQCYAYVSNGIDYMMIANNTMETIKGGDPSHTDNPPHIRRMDRKSTSSEFSIAIYSKGAVNW